MNSPRYTRGKLQPWNWVWKRMAAAKDVLHRPSILIPDTVLIENSVPTMWLFTSKKGKVSKRLKEKVTLLHVKEAFLTTIGDIETDFVAVSHRLAQDKEDVIVDKLSPSALVELLESSAQARSSTLSVQELQIFVESKGGRGTYLEHIFSLDDVGRYAFHTKKHYVVERPEEGVRETMVVQSKVGKLNEELGRLSTEIVQCLQRSGRVRVTQARLKYIVDENDACWFVGGRFWTMKKEKVKKKAVDPKAALAGDVTSRVLRKSRVTRIGGTRCVGDYCAKKKKKRKGLDPELKGDQKDFYRISNKSLFLARWEQLHKEDSEQGKVPVSSALLPGLGMEKLDPSDYYMIVMVCKECYEKYTALDALRIQRRKRASASPKRKSGRRSGSSRKHGKTRDAPASPTVLKREGESDDDKEQSDGEKAQEEEEEERSEKDDEKMEEEEELTMESDGKKAQEEEEEERSEKDDEKMEEEEEELTMESDGKKAQEEEDEERSEKDDEKMEEDEELTMESDGKKAQEEEEEERSEKDDENMEEEEELTMESDGKKAQEEEEQERSEKDDEKMEEEEELTMESDGEKEQEDGKAKVEEVGKEMIDLDALLSSSGEDIE